MLIFGLSARDSVLGTLVFPCNYCGNTAPHHLIRRTRKISLFFIPILPVGTKYLDSCTACGRVIDVPREQAEAAANQGQGLR
jgi:predicted RNA-binding Zn-ribbon protein involved in translation (DUF1610 family)